jgi:hypothetical protein
LVKSNKEGNGVAGIMGDGLEFLDELCCFVGGWAQSVVVEEVD